MENKTRICTAEELKEVAIDAINRMYKKTGEHGAECQKRACIAITNIACAFSAMADDWDAEVFDLRTEVSNLMYGKDKNDGYE